MLSADQRRVLIVLADSPDGCTEAIRASGLRALRDRRRWQAAIVSGRERISIEAAQYLKIKNPNVPVTVRNLATGDTIQENPAL